MRPYIICYMMSSLDGRIDCDMTEKIEGWEEYYSVLESLQLDGCLAGKVTAQMHYAKKEPFISKSNTKVNNEGWYKAKNVNEYTIITDTLGTLAWENNTIDNTHLIIILSENTSIEYLQYLKDLKISYVVTGKNGINLQRAMEILYNEFGIKRIGVVGGGNINGSFLKNHLLDEIIVLIGPGIDGRKGQTALFDGLDVSEEPYRLLLQDVKKYESGTVLLKYILE